MGIYLDSADAHDARRLKSWDSSRDHHQPAEHRPDRAPWPDVLSELVDRDGHVFYQLTGATVEARTDEAWRAYQIRPDKVIIQVPTTTDNLGMVSRLVPTGIECAMTAVYSPTQVFMAGQVRASFVIPYVSQMIAQVDDAPEVLRQMVRVLSHSQTQVLAASLQSSEQVLSAILAGVEHLTLPLT